MSYQAPLRDIRFALEHMAGFFALRHGDAFPELSEDLVEAVLEEAGRVAANVLSPLHEEADAHGVKRDGSKVIVTPGFHEAYQTMVEGGWNALAFPEDWGGQGLPKTLALAVTDMMSGACLSLQLANILTTGSVKALVAVGTDEQKARYLPKLVTGEWAGTMNLTEPQAGSDLSDISTKAEPVGEGLYRISGNKIYITFGDHDMAENICHLVLARLPDAPEGTRGISMFLVPKYRLDVDGQPGEFNNVVCTGTEHKLGQHGAPACSLAFGEGGDSLGELVGRENEGLKNMFIMMNSARIDVGIQGAACAERAFQTALAYAGERRQGRLPGQKSGPQVEIIQHPDVRRMLYMMKSMTEASRAICYATMVASDLSRTATDETARKAAKEREELLTPVAKAFGTDRGVEVTSLGIQVHGGMGFIEESGAPQMFRDVRITPIYEGTNGIQAIDLAGRKLGMEGGRLARDFLAEVEDLAATLKGTDHDSLQAIGHRLDSACEELSRTTDYMVRAGAGQIEDSLAGATPYLDQFGYIAGGFFLAHGARAAAEMVARGEGDKAYYDSKIALARFYTDNILPRALSLTPAVMAGAETVAPLGADILAG